MIRAALRSAESVRAEGGFVVSCEQPCGCFGHTTNGPRFFPAVWFHGPSCVRSGNVPGVVELSNRDARK
jgi:hypothetical protein